MFCVNIQLYPSVPRQVADSTGEFIHCNHPRHCPQSSTVVQVFVKCKTSFLPPWALSVIRSWYMYNFLSQALFTTVAEMHKSRIEFSYSSHRETSPDRQMSSSACTRYPVARVVQLPLLPVQCPVNRPSAQPTPTSRTKPLTSFASDSMRHV
jgi:hypothetical protein